MKKIILAIISIFSVICLCACGSRQQNAPNYEEAIGALKSAAGFDCPIEVRKGSCLNITVDIPESENAALFGTRAYNIINKAREVFTNENGFALRINLVTTNPKYQGKNYIYITASEDDSKYFCHYFDEREETRQLDRRIDMKSPDDLANLYPELKTRLKTESVLTPEELEIWDAVWARLDAEPNREEMKIFEEMATDYDMTAEELNAFVRACMDKVYG